MSLICSFNKFKAINPQRNSHFTQACSVTNAFGRRRLKILYILLDFCLWYQKIMGELKKWLCFIIFFFEAANGPYLSLMGHSQCSNGSVFPLALQVNTDVLHSLGNYTRINISSNQICFVHSKKFFNSFSKQVC